MNLSAKKVEIIALKERREEILEELQLDGSVEIISSDEASTGEVDAKKSDIELKLAEMRFAASFLSRFKEKESFASNLIDSFFPVKDKYTLKEVGNLADSETADKIVSEAQNLEKSLNHIESKLESLTREVFELEKFSGITETDFEGFNDFEIFIGSIATEKKDQLLDTLRKKSIFFFIKWGGVQKSRSGFYMVYPREDSDLVDLVKDLGAKEEEFNWNRPPAELLKEKKSEIEELKRKKVRKIEKAEELAEIIPKVEALIDWYRWELDKVEAFDDGEKTENYFRLKAWVLSSEAERLKKRIKKISPYVLIDDLDLEEGETPPVLVENKSLMESFEVVTGVYGSPKSDEPDPTPFLAPFFAVAFGLALSDAGYGILLIAISYLMGRKLEDSKAFFNLFIIAGLFTVFAGILTGTFFGTDLFADYRIVDAVADPIEVLYLVSVLGIIQVFVGLLIGLSWNYKQGDYATAFGSKGGSVVFFLGIGAFVLIGEIFVLLGSVLLMMALNIIFSKDKNPFKRILSGFGSVYDLIGYFSDVLSYSRLLALGLATGIIAMTINMIASIFMEMIPVTGLGIAVAGFVLIFGHVANLLINALSSFIHAARLQFVEFFSKFMEGGGRRFKPFSKRGRFIEIIKSN